MTTSKTGRWKKGQPVWVEALRPNGSTTLMVGRLVEYTAEAVVLTEACWIADTGRRGEFFAGAPSSSAEWEPHPREALVEIPAPLLFIGEWIHSLEPFRVAR